MVCSSGNNFGLMSPYSREEEKTLVAVYAVKEKRPLGA